jgi:hypothetical protein
MAGPAKRDYSAKVGAYAQSNYEFLMTKLWGPRGRQLRDKFIKAPNQRALKTLLRQFNIPFDANVRIVVVDIETARTNGFSPTAAATDKFYALVLPPAPRRNPREQHYQQMQGWASAHYHAINDSYGM